MSEVDRAAAARRTAYVYIVVVILSMLGIMALLAYSIRLGSLVGPGIEQSFGYALALMFLFSALIFHLVDRTYRIWPLGRRIQPEYPGRVTDTGIALFLKVAVLVAAASALAYILGTLIAG